MKNLITLPHWKYSVSWDIKSGALADFLASWENHSALVVCNEEDGLAILEYSLILIRRHDCQYKTNSCVGSYYPSHNLDHLSSLQTTWCCKTLYVNVGLVCGILPYFCFKIFQVLHWLTQSAWIGCESTNKSCHPCPTTLRTIFANWWSVLQ